MGEGERQGSGATGPGFEAIFRATHPRVLAYALRRAPNTGSAEEVVSETFLIAWRRFDAMPEDPLPWLLGVARKVLANQRRATSRRFPDGPLASLDDVEAHDRSTPVDEQVADRHAFATAFAALSGRDREVLALVAWDGLKPRQAAAVMGCAPAVFSIRLHRARRRLLKELEASGHSLGQAGKPSPPSERPGFTEAR